MTTLPRLIRSLSVFILLFILAPSALAENGLAIDPETCLECHGDVVTPGFAGSVHGQNACTSCH